MEKNQTCQIRAVFDSETIRVYQAYSDVIADSALAQGTFVSPPFKMTRMTWIKPSFLWMMYRAGWGEKDTGQKRILAIDITRQGLEWALTHSCLSHAEASENQQQWSLRKTESPVRIQWDPERNLELQPLAHRAIQIGLSGEAVSLYTSQWIRRISDITQVARKIKALVAAKNIDEAQRCLPIEDVYPVRSEIASRIGMSASPIRV